MRPADISYILETRDDRVEANQSTARRGLAALKVCRGFTKKASSAAVKVRKSQNEIVVPSNNPKNQKKKS